jgi:hypothetical protein
MSFQADVLERSAHINSTGPEMRSYLNLTKKTFLVLSFFYLSSFPRHKTIDTEVVARLTLNTEETYWPALGITQFLCSAAYKKK